MFTCGGLHSVYCWVLPTSWCPHRYDTIGFTAPARHLKRESTPCAVRASLSAENAGTSDEAYQQFADMLGEGSRSKPRTSDTKRAAYAEFAETLGLEDNNTQGDDKSKSLAKLSPKKVEIDPADYHIFDKMLERMGGRGRKPIKGAKPYSRYITRDKKDSKVQRKDDWDAMQGHVSGETVPEEEKEDTASPTIPSLTEDEKAQAYEVMMEEFGPGSSYGVETWTPDDDVDESEPPSPPLMTPPKRPGVPGPAEPKTQAITHASAFDLGTQQEIQEDIEGLTLQPKPPRPSADKATSPEETTKVRESHEKNTTCLFVHEVPLVKAVAQLDPETALLEPEENIQLQDELETGNFETPELKAQPTRPMQAESKLERPHTSADGNLSKLETPTFDAELESFVEPSPTVQPKPQRPQEQPLNSSVRSSFEMTSRSNQRKGQARRQRLSRKESAVVLSNPKLVYRNE